jgi:hypothetical protein
VEITFVNQSGSSVIDYALVFNGIISNERDFKVGHVPLLGNIMDEKFNTKSNAGPQTETQNNKL